VLCVDVVNYCKTFVDFLYFVCSITGVVEGNLYLIYRRGGFGSGGNVVVYSCFYYCSCCC
jgi:hypothetical protein